MEKQEFTQKSTAELVEKQKSLIKTTVIFGGILTVFVVTFIFRLVTDGKYVAFAVLSVVSVIMVINNINTLKQIKDEITSRNAVS